MYHRFAGKSDLALAAIRRSAEQVRAEAEAALSGKGTARDRIAAYLSRERDILRGCPAGRPAQDPEIVAGAELWQPVHETFGRLRERLAAVVTEGKAHGEFASKPDPAHLAASIAAVVQNGYVPARAAGSVEPFDRAAEGVRELLQTA